MSEVPSVTFFCHVCTARKTQNSTDIFIYNMVLQQFKWAGLSFASAKMRKIDLLNVILDLT